MSTPIYDSVTKDKAGNPTLKPTSKVVAGTISGIALTVVVAMLTAVTPDMLSGLGVWSAPVFAGIGALAVALGAYIKSPTGIS